MFHHFNSYFNYQWGWVTAWEIVGGISIRSKRRKKPQSGFRKGICCLYNWKGRDKFRASPVPGYKFQMMPLSPTCLISLILCSLSLPLSRLPSPAAREAPGGMLTAPSMGCIYLESSCGLAGSEAWGCLRPWATTGHFGGQHGYSLGNTIHLKY